MLQRRSCDFKSRDSLPEIGGEALQRPLRTDRFDVTGRKVRQAPILTAECL